MKLTSVVIFFTIAIAARLPFAKATTCVQNCTDSSGGNSCDPNALGLEFCADIDLPHPDCEELRSAGCGSCLGNDACVGEPGALEYLSVGNGTCIGYRACYGIRSARIGNEACYSTNVGQSCRFMENAAINNKACIWANACSFAKHIRIARRSCKGKKSCYKAGGAGSSGSLAGGGSWVVPSQDSIIYIGSDACRGKQACCGVNRTVGAGECNGDYACCNLDVDGCSCGR